MQGTYYKIKSGTFTETAKNDWCPEGSRLLPQYTIDDSLTVFLSMVNIAFNILPFSELKFSPYNS